MCEDCAKLPDYAHAMQKGGRPEDDTQLPPHDWLEIERDELRGDRGRRILRCPACGTRYELRHDYEFLIGGSEDEQTLTRLT